MVRFRHIFGQKKCQKKRILGHFWPKMADFRRKIFRFWGGAWPKIWPSHQKVFSNRGGGSLVVGHKGGGRWTLGGLRCKTGQLFALDCSAGGCCEGFIAGAQKRAASLCRGGGGGQQRYGQDPDVGGLGVPQGVGGGAAREGRRGSAWAWGRNWGTGVAASIAGLRGMGGKLRHTQRRGVRAQAPLSDCGQGCTEIVAN